MESIAFFNNKGGVGKTTLLCNLAGYLSRKCGKKILVIDADPQCNTTSYVLEEDNFYSFYFDASNSNSIYGSSDTVQPASCCVYFIMNIIF